MNSRTIATVAVFAALTVALNLWSPKIPAPYAPYLYYQVWEIPIVAAFLLYGTPIAVGIAIINTIALFAYFPGQLPTGPVYNLAAVLSMLLGLYIIQKSVSKRLSKGQEAILTISFTILGIVTRVAIMSIVNWAFLRYPPPLGFSMAEEALIATIPFTAFFNATLALYTIPIGYFVARAVSLGIKTPISGQRNIET